MTAWINRHFTMVQFIAILIAIASPLLTLGGSALLKAGTKAVEADHQEVLEVAFNDHTADGHPESVVAKIDRQGMVIDQLQIAVDGKLGKDVFEQFTTQLFQQLDRIEGTQ